MIPSVYLLVREWNIAADNHTFRNTEGSNTHQVPREDPQCRHRRPIAFCAVPVLCRQQADCDESRRNECGRHQVILVALSEKRLVIFPEDATPSSAWILSVSSHVGAAS